jgi:uncharacterized Fe-S cluster protein YjdI
MAGLRDADEQPKGWRRIGRQFYHRPADEQEESMPKRVQTYESPDITVIFDPNLCVHSARCLTGLPKVFDVRRRKWIDVQAAPADDIARVIDTCPSGALKYVRSGEPALAATPPVRPLTVITLVTDGPLAVEGRVSVRTGRGEVVRDAERVVLCRCGGTRNQPFCDGSHLSVGFKSTR